MSYFEGISPEPGSSAELQQFADLQDALPALFERILPDPRVPRTVVVVPSLALDPEVLAHIEGVQHYEERMLCMLMLLRLPNTRVIYVTSLPIDPAIIDYYLHLLPGVPGAHARRRLSLFAAYDESPLTTVTEKILARPRLLKRIQEAIDDPESAHMSCFHATAPERTLAVQLKIPIFANDPELAHLGSKSGSRKLFREAGIEMSPGFEDLRDLGDAASALVELKRMEPSMRRAVVKLEEGASGDGNAVFSFDGAPEGAALASWVREHLPQRLRFEAKRETFEHYRQKYSEMGGIVEAWVEGDVKASPSMQGRVNPSREIELISTHDQILGGPTGQIFEGCAFPASDEYRREIQDLGLQVGIALERHRALGRFGVDFVSVREAGAWRHFAIEINLRKGGTTHSYRMLQFLTDGSFDAESGLFRTPSGESRYYQASDNLTSAALRCLTPSDLMDLVVENQLHFHSAMQQGVFFHLIGAMSGHGKLGVVCVADSPERAKGLFDTTARTLDGEARGDVG